MQGHFEGISGVEVCCVPEPRKIFVGPPCSLIVLCAAALFCATPEAPGGKIR
jgi:hypothetical protein